MSSSNVYRKSDSFITPPPAPRVGGGVHAGEWAAWPPACPLARWEGDVDDAGAMGEEAYSSSTLVALALMQIRRALPLPFQMILTPTCEENRFGVEDEKINRAML